MHGGLGVRVIVLGRVVVGGAGAGGRVEWWVCGRM